MDCRLPGFSVHAIFQARILEWVTIPFARSSGNSDTYRGLCFSPRYILYILCLIWYSWRVFMVRFLKNFLENNVILLKYCWFYNAVLIFAVQQSDLVIYLCVCVCVCVCVSCSVTSDFATTWTITRQAPLSMVFSRQEYWSGLPYPSPEDLPNPGIEPWSPAL